MEDLAALAESLAGSVGDARGSLILSRDGLVLGAHPAEAENVLKPAWLKMAALGEPERGFVQFGTETWCYVRRGAYSAFVIVGPGVRPGIAIDQMEQALLAAEEARAKREGIRAPEAPAVSPAAPTSKPRTPLHPDARPVDQPVVIHAEPAQGVSVGEQGSGAVAGGSWAGAPSPTPPQGEAIAPTPPQADAPTGGSADPSAIGPTVGEIPAEAPPAPEELAARPAQPVGGMWASASGGEDEEEDEVDRFSLAREFSQLLQEDQDRADG